MFSNFAEDKKGQTHTYLRSYIKGTFYNIRVIVVQINKKKRFQP